VSDAFNIPMDRIYMSETRTDTVANTSPTAASLSSDLNGMALVHACEQILTRLNHCRKRIPIFLKII
jgi:xanthine dehydrogenase/oxidase